MAEGETLAERDTAYNRVRKVVGKGVHDKAIVRLLELWPAAYVNVHHFDSRNDGVDLRCTQISIWQSDPKKPSPHGEGRTMQTGIARCRLDCDPWNRRHGIDVAFRRALVRVSRSERAYQAQKAAA